MPLAWSGGSWSETAMGHYFTSWGGGGGGWGGGFRMGGGGT